MSIEDTGLTHPRPADLSDVTVIAPAYNEAAALPAVLAALAPLRGAGLDVIVVDDGSTDETARVAGDAGVRVVRLERNVGKAGAVRAGLAVATRPKIILIDADATYPTHAIPEFARLLDDHDVVLGARTEGRTNIPALNRFGNAALRTTIRWFSGFGSVDPLTGLYGIRRDHLEAMELRSRGFGLEAEMGVKAARMGLRWVDHPISYAERIGTSKLRPLRDGAVITWTVIRTLFSGPRTEPAQGRADRLRPAPLAVAATALGITLLVTATILLGAVAALSVAALVDPQVPLTTAITAPGMAALLAGVVLWRLVRRWGRPGPTLLAPVTVAATVGAALLVAAGVLVADAIGAWPDTPRHDVTGSTVVVAAVLALLASPLAYVLALRGAPLVRSQVSDAMDSATGRAALGELLAVAGILLVFAALVGRYISVAPIFGFDEAIYANTARAWVEGTPNTGWSAHRSPGISFLGVSAVPFESETAFRAIGLLSGALAVIAAWALARRLGGPTAGLAVAAVVATIPEMLASSSFFLTDVPSAALVILLMLVAWRELEERPLPSRNLLWLAPIAAAAFYVRYGASLPIALVAASAILLWHRKLLAAWRLAIATAGLLLLLLLPHLVQATLMTGTPVGIVRMAQSLAAPPAPMSALRGFAGLLPGELAGIVAELLMLVGVAAWPLLVFTGRRSGRMARAHTFLVVPAIGHFVLVGLIAFTHVRYVLLPIVLLVVAGTLVAVRLSRRLAVPSREAFATAIVIAAIVSGLATAAVQVRARTAYAPTQDDLIDAALFIRDDAAGASCAILGYPPPQLTWYSACATHHFGYPPARGRERHLRGADRRYLLLLAGESDRYPAGELRERYVAMADGPIAVIPDRVTGDPQWEIYRLRGDR